MYNNRDTESNQSNQRKRKKKFLTKRRRTLDANLVIDYKDPDVLKRFITERGKIIPRRISGATQEQQRRVATAVKRARYLGLIISSTAHRTEKGFSASMQTMLQSFATSGVRSGRSGRDFRDSPRGAPQDQRKPGAEASASKTTAEGDA